MDFINNNIPQQEDSAYTKLYGEVKRLVQLNVENVKLLLTEKLTLLLGRIALVAVAFVISATALIFLSMSVADFLLRGLEPCWTYLIIGSFYVLLIIIACCFRRRLIIDPIARYISRVILDPPVEKEVSSSPASTSKPIASDQ
ncbi:MAG: hypothetical protein NC301_04190 [Bacteroides sp.]|nr:hypothetical protein [Bacteroides sp.]MCM1379476.1 hypothetical protein [Bacteroides sp.]MCM1445921.1 hypothetical protein [Prevotella sp.]